MKGNEIDPPVAIIRGDTMTLSFSDDAFDVVH